MSASVGARGWLREFSIWGFAFGYFACYVPYSALTKALSKGLLPGMREPLSGMELLPPSVLASFLGMIAFLTAMGWWKHATHSQILGVRVPHPTPWTFLSGLCTASIIATTTLAYTFRGVSIVFAMVLMRGGVLILAPVVDAITGRRTRWFSWVGLALSLASVLVALAEKGGYLISLGCAIDIAAYLASYFIRLRFMSRLAKSEDSRSNIRFFVEEQLTATPVVLLLLGALALVGRGEEMLAIRAGFTTFWSGDAVLPALLVGLFSQGTGVFGGLILLDRRENTYCVPVNRCSSVLAGVLASWSLALLVGQRPPSLHEHAGAALIVVAILFLTIPVLYARSR